MSSYRGTAGRPDKAKAIVAVAVVHAALALLIVSGLSVRMVIPVVEHMTTVSIKEKVAPLRRPVKRVRPAIRPERLRNPQGKPGKKPEAAPVIEPQPALVAPFSAAHFPAVSAATNSGPRPGESGTGSAISGSGTGAAGYRDYSGFTPARLIANIPNSEYRQLAATGIPSGLVGVLILVNGNGNVSNCRIARSSGDFSIDELVCQLTLRYVRFDAARDPFGRTVAQDITYFPNWRRR